MKNQNPFLNEISPLTDANNSNIKEIDIKKEFKTTSVIKETVKRSLLEPKNKPYTESIVTRSAGRDRLEIW